MTAKFVSGSLVRELPEGPRPIGHLGLVNRFLRLGQTVEDEH